MNNNNPFNTDSTWFEHMIIKIVFGVLVVAGTAWGAYLNSKVVQIDELKIEMARIEQKLDDIGVAVHAQRH